MAVPNAYPFATLSKGQPSGIIAEAVDALLKDMGYQPHYQRMTTKTMYEAVHNGLVDVGVAMLAFGENASKALYSDGVVQEYSVLVVRTGRKMALSSAVDLHGLKLGGRKGFVYPQIDDDEAISVRRETSDAANMRMLLLNGIDAAIVGGISDLYDLRAEGIMTELEVLDKAVGFVPLGAAFADEKFDQAFLEKFNAALAEFKTTARWTEILEANGVHDLVTEWDLLPKKPAVTVIPVAGDRS